VNSICSLTRDQARELDRIAIGQYGVPGLVLMENAGRACADEAVKMLGQGARGRVVVLCGKGNNGGDGFVVARHLENRGCEVQTFLVGETDAVLRAADECAVNLRIVLNMGIPVVEVRGEGEIAAALQAAARADLVVDAMLGTGLSGEVRGPYRALIEGINGLGVPVLSVDVPSGLDCDTGRALGVAVKADRTVTFVLTKRGYAQPGAEQFTGQVRVAQISMPRRMIESKLAEWREKEK